MSEIHSFHPVLELVTHRGSYENQVISIELTLEAFSLGSLIHFAFAKIDPRPTDTVAKANWFPLAECGRDPEPVTVNL